MRSIAYCRRTFIAACGLSALFTLGAWKGIEVGVPIASICIGLAGANAYEASKKASATTVFGAS